MRILGFELFVCNVLFHVFPAYAFRVDSFFLTGFELFVCNVLVHVLE